jgi:hypothetical protein
MHELHRKYHHGDYIDLDNVKEENDEDHQILPPNIGPNRDYLNFNNVNMNMKQPLLKSNSFGSSRLKINYNEEDDERESNNSTVNNINEDVNNTTLTSYHQQQPSNNRNRSGSNNNNNNNSNDEGVTLNLI